MTITTKQVLEIAERHLYELVGHKFDVLTVEPPVSPEAAINLSKIISKLSPILGNLIEFNVVEYLSDKEEFKNKGDWVRQDPGFPDAIFKGVEPQPGFEIKAWFPLSTEITARFKDSQNHFVNENTNVCMLAWLPEYILYGKPKIIGVVIVSGKSVAEARDNHYHKPPHYLVLEPENTVNRTRNLQQTNTNGYKIQDPTSEQIELAKSMMASWGDDGEVYKPTKEYQDKLRALMSVANYRLDTNYAKMDRIVHTGLESFKESIMKLETNGMKISEWAALFRSSAKVQEKLRKAIETHEAAEEAGNSVAAARALQKIELIQKEVQEVDEKVSRVLSENLNIKDVDAEQLLE